LGRLTLLHRGLLLFLFVRVGAEEVEDLLAHVLELDAQVEEDLSGDALVLLDQAQEQVLGADVVVAEVPASPSRARAPSSRAA
jgi:hypothetical protein